MDISDMPKFNLLVTKISSLEVEAENIEEAITKGNILLEGEQDGMKAVNEHAGRWELELESLAHQCREALRQRREAGEDK